MIVLQRRFSNVVISDTEISPTLEAGAGGGGNNLPMIIDEHNEHSDGHGFIQLNSNGADWSHVESRGECKRTTTMCDY